MALTNKEASVILGMAARGDNDHDIAAWFGVNQGRIAEVKSGSHGSISAANKDELFPKGPPGLKGRRLRGFVKKAIIALEGGDVAEAMSQLNAGLERFDRDEA